MAIQELFEHSGRAGLSALAIDADPVIALHAIWEQDKGRPREQSTLREAFRERVGIDPPQWWQRLLQGVIVYERCHYFPGVDDSHLALCSRLQVGNYELVATPSCAGFRYAIEMRDLRSSSIVWRNQVWAAGRTALTGLGVHQIEMVVSEQRLFVFGAESHGAYAEAFRLSDGVPLFRFCTCYWFNFSELWHMSA
jgi:hypothetical protein